jgi:hypothetical protein
VPTAPVSIVSIHDTKNAVLACDLDSVLSALRPYLDRWVWCITALDAAGRPSTAKVVEEMAQRVARAGRFGFWLTSQELTTLAGQIAQTVDGTLLAFPAGTARTRRDEATLHLAAFPGSDAELAIQVVDSSFLEIYAKDHEIPSVLRQHFQDVREEDPHTYFGAA